MMNRTEEKNTLHNTGDNLWLVQAHSENPHGFSSGLGFVCYISCSIHATAHSQQTLCNIKENHLRKTFIILILTFTSFHINSQENKIVEGRFNPVSSFIDYSEFLEGTEKVPENIKINLELYLKVILGDWFDKITFYEGLIADLDGHFKENPLAYKRGWLATKYQFIYLLSDENIGISKYYIKIDMDEYGQIINCNWPSKDFNYTYFFDEKTSKPFQNNFQSNELMFENAMKWAKANSVPTDNYTVELTYNKEKNTMCFTFEFLTEKRGNRRSYRVAEFNWLNGLKVDEYSLMSVTNH